MPELALVAGTRAALGAGLGLLLAGRLREGSRRAVGWTLVAVGALSTIPLALEILGRGLTDSSATWNESAAGDPWYEPTEYPLRGGTSVPS
jgi:hypothetical protein